MIKLSDIKVNPGNPRKIREESIEKLIRSIEAFPGMMELRPIVVDEDGMILGGNMRYQALLRIGKKTVPDKWIKRAEKLTEEEKTRFVIEDNVSFGDWDTDALADWDSIDLSSWGVPDSVLKNLETVEDGEEIEFEQSIQIEPPQEYVLIIADPNSPDWDDLKTRLKLGMKRKGGYKKGSAFDAVGLERVIPWSEFKKRFDG